MDRNNEKWDMRHVRHEISYNGCASLGFRRKVVPGFWQGRLGFQHERQRSSISQRKSGPQNWGLQLKREEAAAKGSQRFVPCALRNISAHVPASGCHGSFVGPNIRTELNT
eukprot:1000836-Amphidinium_carterae.1